MALPQQYLFTILEVAGRWGCTQAQIVNMAIGNDLDLVVGFCPIKFGEDAGCGLMSVAGSDVRPLFRPFGKAEKKVYVKQARRPGTEDWKIITEPAEGVGLAAADIMITASEMERFEDAHGVGRGRSSGPGAPSRYDWDGFYIALMKRVHINGFPARQKDLIVEMQEWFIANSPVGEAPDESTIRRRIQTVWQALNGG